MSATAGRAAAGRAAWRAAAGTPDPELPMVTVADLGILRSVEQDGDRVVVVLSPTYSGCPALPEIAADVRRRLTGAGFSDVVVRIELSPPWRSDWITPAGRRKLATAGIAPPEPRGSAVPPRTVSLLPWSAPPDQPACPNCGGVSTEQTAAFGSTACKALYRCRSCREPFEYVKSVG